MKRQRPIDLLTLEEVHRILDAFSTRYATGLRSRALVAVMAFSGLRIGEALALKPADLKLAQRKVNVRKSKGRPGGRGLVALPLEAHSLLEAWLKKREELGIPKSAPLFCTISEGTRKAGLNLVDSMKGVEIRDTLEPGRPLYRSQVNQALKRAAVRAGLGDRRISCHTFRHSFASTLLEKGVNLESIRQALGHSSIATTATYLDSLNPQRAIDEINGLDWSA